ncbi:MAG: hypothetical protein NTX65_12375 [Ignavibacteriales bacterium]|nr:hypothetical protein [Ignavibacteriales bacterium]
MIEYDFEEVKDKKLADLNNAFSLFIEEDPIKETYDINNAIFLRINNNYIKCQFEIDAIGEFDCIEATRVEFGIDFVKGMEIYKPLIKKYSIDSKDVDSVCFNLDQVLQFQITLEATTLNELVQKLKSFFREWHKERRDQASAFCKEFNLS